MLNLLFKSGTFLLLKESEHLQVIIKLDPDLIMLLTYIAQNQINHLICRNKVLILLLKYYTKTYLYFCTSIQQKQKIK
ncbi:hypothetical protein V1478_000559 [Vespula squamosa]|uniref:Uncharacterized protein n=1 Tax=Vespula squamosa TaxID=30214 RepID=A0ABD2C7W6_VESSQ